MGEEFGGQASRTQQRHQGERACARLLGLIAGITADGHLHDLEIQFLRTWLAENTQAADHWLGAQLAAARAAYGSLHVRYASLLSI